MNKKDSDCKFGAFNFAWVVVVVVVLPLLGYTWYQVTLELREKGNNMMGIGAGKKPVGAKACDATCDATCCTI
jgi:hypothetical protein